MNLILHDGITITQNSDLNNAIIFDVVESLLLPMGWAVEACDSMFDDVYTFCVFDDEHNFVGCFTLTTTRDVRKNELSASGFSTVFTFRQVVPMHIELMKLKKQLRGEL